MGHLARHHRLRQVKSESSRLSLTSSFHSTLPPPSACVTDSQLSVQFACQGLPPGLRPAVATDHRKLRRASPPASPAHWNGNRDTVSLLLRLAKNHHTGQSALKSMIEPVISSEPVFGFRARPQPRLSVVRSLPLSEPTGRLTTAHPMSSTSRGPLSVGTPMRATSPRPPARGARDRTCAWWHPSAERSPRSARHSDLLLRRVPR